MMKKIAISIVCPLIGVFLLASCMGEEEEIEKSSAVALLSFGIKDLKTVPKGILPRGISRKEISVITPMVMRLLAKKTVTMKISAMISFMRGSMRWRGEFPGKYCPIVMSFSIWSPPFGAFSAL